MLITKLAAYARENNLVDDPLFEMKAVNFLVTIREDGATFGVRPLGDGKRGEEARVPKKVGGNAGGVATFGTDNARFVLGFTDTGEPNEKTTRDLAAFRELLRLAAEDEPGLRAASDFYDNADRVSAAREAARAAGAKEADRVALSLASDAELHLANTPAGSAFWRRYRAAQDAAKPKGEAVLCLSCGELRPPVATNDTKIMGLSGGQPSGTALVSFDKDAFQSHGWDQNANAAVCEECSQAYTRGLNRLLKRDNTPRTRIDEGGVAFVAWAGAAPPAPPPNGADRDAGGLEELLRGMEQGLLEVIDEPNTDHAIAVFQAISSGKPLVGEPDRRLYVLGLRGNGGRAVVVDWFDVALTEAYRNVKRWFDDLQIQLIFDQTRTDPKTKVREVLQEAGSLSAPVSRWMLGKATVREGQEVPKHLSAALIRAALRGDPLPLTVAEAAMTRLRLEKNGFGDYLATARIGLIRCTLNRRSLGERTLMPGLDPDNNQPAYLCGRLLATLEAIQYAGVGDVGANIVDRFYGKASTAPALVFGPLLTLAQSHLGAINNEGQRVNLNRELSDIIGRLEPDLPRTLNLEDQGRFAIGYYHQKAYRFAETRRRKDERAAATTPTGTEE